MLGKALLFTTMSALVASSALAQGADSRGGSTTSGMSTAPIPGSPESASTDARGAADPRSGAGPAMSGTAGGTAKSAESRQMQQTLREIQQALKDNGHDPGEIDGIMGPKTKAAVRSFQHAQGLNVTGFIDGETLARLAESAAASGRTESRAAGSGPIEGSRTDTGSSGGTTGSGSPGRTTAPGR